MVGDILIYFTFASTLFSAAFYLMSGKKDIFLKLGRISFYAVTAGFVLTSMFMLSNILSHNYQYKYIWEHSSNELPDYLLVATFYAGQEGSFLLWGLLMSILGYFAMPYLQKRGYEGKAMGIFAAVLFFVALILLVKNPFTMIWEVADWDVPIGHNPENGRGLNPVLQNYWISIHPPILFTGYASLTVPFAIAIAGLFKGDHRGWIKVAMPWTLWAAGILGFGIMLGGFWAYETLGWGGFWAWDPVENSSLIPWLFIVAAVHTMIASKRTGGLLKTNYFLVILSFIFVLYASFLTRSGILGDTSVHSFVDPGATVYNLLLAMMAVFGIFSIAYMFWNVRRIPVPKKGFELSSKEYGLSLGASVLILIGSLVVIGTSKPILSDLFGGLFELQRSVVEPEIYNNINLWLAILMLLLSSYVVNFNWRKTNMQRVMKDTFFPLLVSVGFTVMMYFFGVDQPKYMLLLFSTVFSFYISLDFIIKYLRKDLKMTGAFIAHLGIAILVLGALASGAYSESQRLQLNEGESGEVLGYTITYKGKNQIEKFWQDREKYELMIDVEKDGKKYELRPIQYWSDYNDRQQPFFEPGIKGNIAGDLYVFPYSLEMKFKNPPLILSKEQKEQIPLDSNYSIQLLKYIMPKPSSFENQGVQFGGLIRLSSNDYVLEDTIYTIFDQESKKYLPVWKTYDSLGVDIAFVQMDVNQEELSKTRGVFAFRETGGTMEKPYDVFTFEVSTKPFIRLVWAGTIFIALGFFISIAKHIGKKTHTINNSDDKDVEFGKVSITNNLEEETINNK